jgi:hypothetical protein
MTAPPPLSRADFEQLLAAHQRLIELANDLEYQLYRLGEVPGNERVTDCQQAAGALLGLLRDVLFRHDQQVLPLLDSLSLDSTR